MARPIEPTPILYGKDAQRVLESALKEETNPDPARLAFLKKCRETYAQNPF